jgi:hypothetical protein
MGAKKGTLKGLVAIASGYVAQASGRVPEILFGPGELTQYSGFVVGTFLGLVAADILARDVHPGRPVYGAVKGLSAAIGAAIPLVYLGDFGPFLTLCSVAGGPVESVVGVGGCYPYLKLVTGTFVGVVVGDVFLAPFSSGND